MTIWTPPQANLDTERWLPYLRWTNNFLGSQDTLISFNYDCVLDLLSKSTNRIDVRAKPGRSNGTVAYKLHGSVNWKLHTLGHSTDASGLRTERFDILPQEDHDFALSAPDDQILIASPGPSKQRMAKDLLGPLWDSACQSIREADVVVLVGYRFPQSDAYARQRLLEALSNNTSTNLRIHIALGPERTPDVHRLEELIAFARGPKKYAIRTHRLWAEDFIGHCSRPLLETS